MLGSLSKSSNNPLKGIQDSSLVFLDFDGVLVQSNQIKDNAFELLFREISGDRFDEVWRYHLASDAVPRQQKIRHIVEEILCLPGSIQIIQDLVNRFSHLTFEAVCSCDFIPGADEFLKEWGRHKALVLVSATPYEVLSEVLRVRGLTRFFEKVYGAPNKKHEVMTAECSAHSISPSEAWFIGDSYSDWQAAKKAEVRFLGMAGRYAFPPDEVYVLPNFRPLLRNEK